MYYNSISSIPSGIFSELTSLKYLEQLNSCCARARENTLPRCAESGPPLQLHRIYRIWCVHWSHKVGIAAAPAAASSDVHESTKRDLHSNKITCIQPNSFSDLTNLVSLGSVSLFPRSLLRSSVSGSLLQLPDLSLPGHILLSPQSHVFRSF